MLLRPLSSFALLVASAAAASADAGTGTQSSPSKTAASYSYISGGAGGSAISTATSMPWGSRGASAPSITPPIQQYYQELCPTPKSCRLVSYNNRYDTNNKQHNFCSYGTLQGLASTRQAMVQSMKDEEASSERRMALDLRSSHVQLEEASVGCALLFMNIHTDAEKTPTSCTKPKTCSSINANNNGDHSGGAYLCNGGHFILLKKSKDALESSLLLFDGDNTNQEMVAIQLELTELRAEMAAVGCDLLLQYQVDVKKNEKDETVSFPPSDSSHRPQKHETSRAHPSIRLINTLQQDDNEDQFLHFLDKNYKHFISTPQMGTLERQYQQLQAKKSKSQHRLKYAGTGEIPDIAWQERASREKAVVRLAAELKVIRRQLLDFLLHRVGGGGISLGDLDLSISSLDGEDLEGGERNIWDEIADDLQEMEAVELRGKEKEEGKQKMKKELPNTMSQDQHSDQPDPPVSSSSSQECHGNGNEIVQERSCESSPDPSQVGMIDDMKRDIKHLRIKAAAANSPKERNARLSIVNEMERQLKLMTSGKHQ